MAGNPKDHPFTPTSDTNTQCKWCSFQEPAHDLSQYPPTEAIASALVPEVHKLLEDLPVQMVNVTLMVEGKLEIVGRAEVKVASGVILTSKIRLYPEYEWLLELVQAVPVQHSLIKKESQ